MTSQGLVAERQSPTSVAAADCAGVRSRPILFRPELVREILAGRKTVTRRPVKPQPPSVDAVRKRSGAEFHLFSDAHRPPDVFRVAGPVWAVKEEMGTQVCPEWRSPYGAPGDRLWVRETWWKPPRITPRMLREGADTWPEIEYDADVGGHRADELREWGWKRKPGIHLPRQLSRLALEVTGVRVELLHGLAEEEARAEGAVAMIQSRDGRAFDMDMAHWAHWTKALDPVAGTGSARGAFACLWHRMYGDTPHGWKANPWVWVVSFKRAPAPGAPTDPPLPVMRTHSKSLLTSQAPRVPGVTGRSEATATGCDGIRSRIAALVRDLEANRSGDHVARRVRRDVAERLREIIGTDSK